MVCVECTRHSDHIADYAQGIGKYEEFGKEKIIVRKLKKEIDFPYIVNKCSFYLSSLHLNCLNFPFHRCLKWERMQSAEASAAAFTINL